MPRADDMTRGKPLALLVRFALPLMLSSILQQLYSLADSMVVGRLLGVEAFAAVGAASFLNWLPLSMLLGLSQGFGVLFAQRFGAGDGAGLRRAAAMGLLLGAGSSLFLTALGLAALPLLLTLMRVPAELMEGSAQYLTVLWLGLLVFALYNVSAALLRALGDSRTPLMALAVSTAVNIALDILFVAAFHMGIRGVALATVVSQAVSFVYCAVALRSLPFAMPRRADYALDLKTAKRLLSLGVPPLLRDGVVAVGGLFIQTVINGFGVAFIAGTTAARRYFSMLEMVGAALEGALATFVAQNAGAKRPERIALGTRAAVIVATAAAVITAAAAFLLAGPLVWLFVAQAEAEVLRVGVEALRVTALFLPVLYLLYLYRAALQGMGDTVTPMLSGFAELLLRIACVLLLPPLLGRWGVYTADAVGWVGAAALLTAVYHARKAKAGRLSQRAV